MVKMEKNVPKDIIESFEYFGPFYSAKKDTYFLYYFIRIRNFVIII